jgi:methyltransferase
VPLSLQLYLVFLGLLYAERGLELVVSQRNVRRMRAAGAVEHGRRRFFVMAAFHALFPALAAIEVLLLHRAFPGFAGYAALGVALLAQGLRWWAVRTLGPAWNVRVVVASGREPVTSGPYRFLRHPNYLAVVLEMAAVPLIHGAWLTAVLASVVNAILLADRIRTEERALGPRYAELFAEHRRLLPGVRHDRA